MIQLLVSEFISNANKKIKDDQKKNFRTLRVAWKKKVGADGSDKFACKNNNEVYF